MCTTILSATTVFLSLGLLWTRRALSPADQASRAAEFGAWIKGCYGAPVSADPFVTLGTVSTLTLSAPTTIDRISIGEDLQFGQRVRAYTVSVHTGTPPAWQLFSAGTAIGHKQIDISGVDVLVTAVRLNVTSSVAAPKINLVAAFVRCSNPA
jgi:hypothetical protein